MYTLKAAPFRQVWYGESRPYTSALCWQPGFFLGCHWVRGLVSGPWVGAPCPSLVPVPVQCSWSPQSQEPGACQRRHLKKHELDLILFFVLHRYELCLCYTWNIENDIAVTKSRQERDHVAKCCELLKTTRVLSVKLLLTILGRYKGKEIKHKENQNSRPRPTFVAEIVPAASGIASWTGRTGSSIFVWSMTPPVASEKKIQSIMEEKTWQKVFKDFEE